MFEKVPQPFSSGGKVATMRKMKYLMRGPEQVHNTLLYGDCGIQVSRVTGVGLWPLNTMP